jgi:type II secretory pathway pseudopilin PulG
VNVWRRSVPEQGETLLEILIAVAIMGIATAAILGLFQESIGASTIHKEQSVAGSLLDNFAEYMQDQGTAPYTDCPSASTAYATDMSTFVGLTQTPTSVVFESDSSKYQLSLTISSGQIGAPGSNPSVTYPPDSTSAACSAVSTDQGVQRLALTVTSTDSKVAETVQVVKWRR